MHPAASVPLGQDVDDDMAKQHRVRQDIERAFAPHLS
jgi:hypothetical protein